MVLICQFADFELTVAGSTFDRVCSKCGVRLMLAPSGQAALMRDPTMELACITCGMAGVHSLNDIAPLPIADVVRELKTVRPNMWRKRN
jgi:hypothetical protein